MRLNVWVYQNKLKIESDKEPTDHEDGDDEDDPDEIFLEPHVPFEFVCSALELFGLVNNLSGFFLGFLQISLSLIDESHVLFHNLLNGLKFTLHSFDIFHRFGIVELFFFLLDDSVKFNKIVTTLNALQPGLHIVSS